MDNENLPHSLSEPNKDNKIKHIHEHSKRPKKNNKVNSGKRLKSIKSFCIKHKGLLISIILLAIVAFGVWYLFFKPVEKVVIDKNNKVVVEYNNRLPELKKAVDKNPKDASIRRNYAIALYVIKDYAAARDQYEEAVKLDGKDAITYNNLGNVYRDMKNYNKAIEAYNKAIGINPKYINAYVNMATIQLYSQNNSNEAIKTYQKALKALPKDDQVELLLGKAYEKAGKISEAKQAYKNILSRSPDNKAAKASLDGLNKK